MAITTTTISKSVGWARTDLILQLEEAFTWLGWHGSTQTGIITSISAYNGGGVVGSSSTDYFDVFPVSTSGIGTGASFRVDRTSGSISAIYVNRPGVGYTNGEYLTLSAEDIGGSVNGASGIGITVLVAGGASPVGYGSTTSFYDKDVTAGATSPWGILRLTVEPGKKFGDTYRGFNVAGNTIISFVSGTSFHPWDITNSSNRGNGTANRFAGQEGFDIPADIDPISSSAAYTTSSGPSFVQTSFTVASLNSYQLDLNIFRSGIDPKFAVFSYRHPTLSSTNLTGNTYATFIIHNFTSSLWDLNEVYLGGMTNITPSGTALYFDTYVDGAWRSGYYGTQRRTAEFGYTNPATHSQGYTFKRTTYRSNSAPLNTSTGAESGIFVRGPYNTSNYRDNGDVQTLSQYNAVIKGIPLNAMLIPSPYYIPDDFVLIDFRYNVPSANIQQGDTITISGSEVYTVITGGYQQSGETSGILFCARTV